MKMTKRAVLGCVLCSLVLAMLGWTATPANALTRSGSLAASRSVAAVSEYVRFTGTVPPRATRSIALQRYSSGRWTTLARARTSRTGAFAFTSRMVSRPSRLSYRVYAAAARVAGRRYPAIVTPTRTISVVAQRGNLTSPASPVLGSSTTFTAQFTPARTGRRVSLQTIDQETEDGWDTVATATEDSRGVVRLRWAGRRLGDVAVRAVALTAGGAPAVASPTRRPLWSLSPALGSISHVTSNGPVGADLNGVSRDGRLVAMATTTNDQSEVLVRDVAAGTTATMPPGMSHDCPLDASISKDGSTVAFAPDVRGGCLIEGPDNQGVFVSDVAQKSTLRITPDVAGYSYRDPSVSADGRYVSYLQVPESETTEEGSRTYLWDRTTGTRVTVGPATFQAVAMSDDATVFVGESSDGGTSTLATYDATDGSGRDLGIEGLVAAFGDAAISGNGRYVVAKTGEGFNSPDPSIVYPQIWRFDLQDGSVQHITEDGNFDSGNPSISDDGTVIGFSSTASNLAPGDRTLSTEDAFVWRQDDGATTGQTTRLPTWVVLPRYSEHAVLVSGDGRTMSLSGGDHLVPGDTDQSVDIYRWTFATPATAN